MNHKYALGRYLVSGHLDPRTKYRLSRFKQVQNSLLEVYVKYVMLLIYIYI